MGSRARFRDVLAHGEFRALWSADVLSVAGDQLARVALAVLVFDRTASAGLTAATYALTFVPALLGGILLGGLADRFPRRRVMVAADVLRACLAAAMVLPGLPLPVLMALVFVLTLTGAPFKAAQIALLPQVVPASAIASALALRTVTNQTAQLIGFAGGGALVLAIGPGVALSVNAATFLISAAVLAIGVRHREAARRGGERTGPQSSAARLLWQDRRLRGLVALSWLVGLFVVPEGLAAPYAATIGTAALLVGLLMAADPVGSIVGAWLVSRVGDERRTALMTPMAIAAGVPLLGCLAQPPFPVVVALWAVSGACSTMYLLIAQSEFTLSVPDRVRGAASGLAGAGVLTSQGVAIVAGGVLADVTGPAFAVAVSGAAGIVLASLIGVTWLRARPSRAGRGPTSTTDSVTSPCSSSPAPPPSEGTAEYGTMGADGVIITHQISPEGNCVTPADVRRPAHPSAAFRRWELWQMPARVLCLVIGVEAITAAVVAVLIIRDTVTEHDLTLFGVLLGLGVVAAELSRHIEHVRRRYSDTPHVNLSSVWTISAALVLPPTLVVATVVVLYLHMYWRSWYRLNKVRPYRLVFTGCAVVLACVTARATVDALAPGLPATAAGTVIAVAAAILLYSVVNSGLVGAAICLAAGRFELRRSLGTGRENALEYATLALGSFTAVLVTLHPAWAIGTLPVLIVVHRTVLFRQLEEAATTDHKTGLLNAAAWNHVAEAEIARAGRESSSLAVLMVDIDHFKRLNDTYGHQTGDFVLKAVAEALTDVVRPYDEVGRWGGEEFAILCPELSPAEAVTLAERMGAAIRAIRVTSAHGADVAGVSASIGVATYPQFGPELADVLLAADDSLFVAKDQGRDRTIAASQSVAFRLVTPAPTRPG